jgi:hypothetical protein
MFLRVILIFGRRGFYEPNEMMQKLEWLLITATFSIAMIVSKHINSSCDAIGKFPRKNSSDLVSKLQFNFL